MNRLPTSTRVTRLPLRTVPGGLCLSALLLSSAALAAPPTEQAGVSSAVKGKVARTSTVVERDQQQVLNVGSKVYMQDRVFSDPSGRAQLLLRDQSTFKLGPDSSVVIDEFIYDPEQGTGEMVVEAANGVFRFISGAIGKSDADSVQINTPLGTLGVRGTMVTVNIQRGADGEPKEALYVLNGPGVDNNALARRGAIQVSAQGETVTVQRTGWGTFVRPGQAPSPPQPIPSQTLAALNQAFSAQPDEDTGPGAPGIASSIAETGVDRFTGQTTARTRDQGEIANESDQTQENTRSAATGENLENEQLPEDKIADLDGMDDMDDMDNMDDMEEMDRVSEFGSLQTYAGLRQIETGSASISQTGVPLFRVSDLENLDSGDFSGTTNFDALTDLEFTGAEQVGSYDANFAVDFSAKTFTMTFENVTLPGFEIDGALEQPGSRSIPTGDATAIFTAAAGIEGVQATGACSDAQCVGLVAALRNNNQSLSGILSLLSAGTDPQVIGLRASPAE